MASRPRPDIAAAFTAVIVQQGKVLDFIDGKTQREETPEEYVRQEIAKSLVREYGYPKKDIAVEFTLRLGSRKPRADLVLFATGDEHEQASARVIVECKEQRVKSSDRKEGVGQLQSYMAACPNAEFGMWTNGLERFCFRKVESKGKLLFEDIPDLPSFGQSGDDSDRPKFDQLKPASSDALLLPSVAATTTSPATKVSRNPKLSGSYSSSSSARFTTSAIARTWSSTLLQTSESASTAR